MSFASGSSGVGWQVDSRASRGFAGEGAGATLRDGENRGMDYRDVITVEADKRGGRACIRGLRITVDDVVSWLGSGMSEEEIVSDYPDLTREDVRAEVGYAADHELGFTLGPI